MNGARDQRVGEERERERVERARLGQAEPAADLHRLRSRRRTGAPPKRGCSDDVARERRRAELEQRARLARSGPAARRRASASSEISGPLHGTEKAASASAISRPSCSMRAESVLSERPARSIVVRIVTGPGSGARA